MHCIYEENSVVTPPFPISLTNNTTAEIGKLTICRPLQQCGCLIVTAVVNWSATFTPPDGVSATVSTAGYADIVIELLFNNNVIYRVFQTALQKAIPLPPALFSSASTTCEIAPLLYSYQMPFCFNSCGYYDMIALHATAKLVAPVVSTGTAAASANIGAVTLIAEVVNMHRTKEDTADVIITE
ncbi:MAG: hypothetical protein ABFC84_03395 [Veillonellales bacterium]